MTNPKPTITKSEALAWMDKAAKEARKESAAEIARLRKELSRAAVRDYEASQQIMKAAIWLEYVRDEGVFDDEDERRVTELIDAMNSATPPPSPTPSKRCWRRRWLISARVAHGMPTNRRFGTRQHMKKTIALCTRLGERRIALLAP